MQCSTSDRIAPLIDDFLRVDGGRYTGPVCTRRCNRLAIRLDEAGEAAMRGPSHRDATFRSTKLLGHPLLAARKNKCQRSGPEAGGELRCIARQMKPKSRDHIARRHDEQERLVRRPTLERNEIRDGFPIDAAAESVDGLRRVSEHLSRMQQRQRRWERRFDFIKRPERRGERRNGHSFKILSASARKKSASVVIFIARSLPGTTTTCIPSRSQRAASSVALMRSRKA